MENKTKTRTIVGVLVVVIGVLCTPSFACKCMPPESISNRKNKAGASFIGKAIEIERDSSSRMVKTKFSTSELWIRGKKEPASIAVVESEGFGAGCEAKFPVGTIAIIFANRLREGNKYFLETNLCKGNIINPNAFQIDSMETEYSPTGLFNQTYSEPDHNKLEAYQKTGISLGMAHAEQSIKKKEPLRFFICVNDSEPSTSMKQALQKSYKGIRWCFDNKQKEIHKNSQNIVVNLKAPLHFPIKEFHFIITADSIPHKTYCWIPFDAGVPTSAKQCLVE